MENLFKKEHIIRFIKFGVVGITGIGVNSLVLWLFHEVLNVPLALASVLAVSVAMYNNFTFNDLWTWKSNKSRRKHNYFQRLLRYVVSASLGAGINYIILILLAEFTGMHYLIANLIGIAAGTASNFLLGEYWVFKSGDT
ncbi:MAG: GtrA family protein [Melioribacteraceae bacterium]|nr:GtrA family protein [Melioribacteraceae bacterium]